MLIIFYRPYFTHIYGEMKSSQIILIVQMQQRIECCWFEDTHRTIIGRPDPHWWDLASMLVFVTDEDDMAPQFEGTTFYSARVASATPIVSHLAHNSLMTMLFLNELAEYSLRENQQCVCICV